MKSYQRALIIDDDVDLCLLLKAILNTTIAEVKCAYTISSGKDMLLKFKPELVFLDNNLPDGQGIYAISEIKAVLPHCLVIVISAIDNSREKAMENGADIFIEKPLTHSNIYEALRQHQR